MNTDKMQTLLGIFEGMLIGAGDYFVHLSPEGVNYKAPTFWVGLVLAASRGVKGYYAAGVKPE